MPDKRSAFQRTGDRTRFNGFCVSGDEFIRVYSKLVKESMAADFGKRGLIGAEQKPIRVTVNPRPYTRHLTNFGYYSAPTIVVGARGFVVSDSTELAERLSRTVGGGLIVSLSAKPLHRPPHACTVTC